MTNLMFHSSRRNIGTGALWPFTHFGTLKAAIDRLYKSASPQQPTGCAFLYAARIESTQPMSIFDPGFPRVAAVVMQISEALRSTGHDAEAQYVWKLSTPALREALSAYRKIPSSDLRDQGPEFLQLRKIEAEVEKTLSIFLKERNYDTVVYENLAEDIGHITVIPITYIVPVRVLELNYLEDYSTCLKKSQNYFEDLIIDSNREPDPLQDKRVNQPLRK